MGESQSKQKQEKEEIPKSNNNLRQRQRSLSPKSGNNFNQQKLEKIPTCINTDKISEMHKREDQIVQYAKGSQNNNQQQVQDFNVQDCIDFKLVPRYDSLQISFDNSVTLPVMISLETKVPETIKEVKRPPIDLVCVIDDSGSMYGKKAQLVRQSLKYLLKILGEDDRICLIAYDNKATLLTPFLRNTELNKAELKKAIKFVQGRGGTETTAGIEHGLWMIKNRQFKNPVTCMFLLSDGVDNKGKSLPQRVKSLITDYDIQEQFTINSYGYGSDHDPETMMNIANQKDGNFYYIENLKKVSDWFILSLSGLLTVLAENIEIRLKQEPEYPIQKYYGDEQLWDQDYIIHLPHLVQNSKKEYLIEIQVPKFKNELKDQDKKKKMLGGHLLGTGLQGKNKEIEIESQLEIQLFNPQENLVGNEPKEQFEVNFLRAKGGEIIGQACALSDKGKFDEANKLLDQFLEEIEKSPFKESNGIVFIKDDILKSKNVCKPQEFKQGGKAFMFKKNKDHIQRQASLCNFEDWDDNQQEVFQNYENGDYNLSDNSVMDSGDDENVGKFQQQRQASYGSFRNRSICSLGSQNSYIEDEMDQNSPQPNNKRKSSLIFQHKQNDFSYEEEDSDIEQEQNNKAQPIRRSSVVKQKPKLKKMNSMISEESD